jgi:hypothetical protein
MGFRAEPSTTVRRLSRSAATSAALCPAVAACSVYVLHMRFKQTGLPPSFATYCVKVHKGLQNRRSSAELGP